METALNLSISQVTNTISDFDNVVKNVKKEPPIENDAYSEEDLEQAIPSDLVEIEVNIKQEPESEEMCGNEPTVPIFYPIIVPSTSTSVLPEVADHESGSTLRRSTRNRQRIKVENTITESNEVNNCFQNFLNSTFNDNTHAIDDKTQAPSGFFDQNVTNLSCKNLGPIKTDLEESLSTVTKKTQDLNKSSNAKKRKRGRGQKLTYRKPYRSQEYLEVRKQKSREAHRKKREEMRKLEEHIKDELKNLGFPDLISQHKNTNTFVLPQINQETTDGPIEHATNGFSNLKDDSPLKEELDRLMAEWQKILEYRARVRDNARNRRQRLREKGNKRKLEEYRAKCRAYMRKKRSNQEFRELEKHRDKIKARERRQRRSLIDELMKPGRCGVDEQNTNNSNPLEILQQINFSSANIQSGLLAALNHKLSHPKSKQEQLAKTYERRNNNPEYKRQSRMNRLQRYFGFPGLVRGRKRCSLCNKYFQIAYDIVQIKKQRSKGKNIVSKPKKRGRPKKDIADGANSQEVHLIDHEFVSCDEDELYSDFTLGTLDRQLRMVQYDLEVKCTCHFRDIPEDKPEAERNAIRTMILNKQMEVVREQISGIKRTQSDELKSNFSFREKEREKAKRRARELRKRKYSNTSEGSHESVKLASDDSETGDFHNFLFQKVDVGTFDASTNEGQTDPIGISNEVDVSVNADQPCKSEPHVVEASPITSLGIEYVKKRREAERQKKARQRKEARIQKEKKLPKHENQEIVNTAERLDVNATESENDKRLDDVIVEPPKVILLEFD